MVSQSKQKVLSEIALKGRCIFGCVESKRMRDAANALEKAGQIKIERRQDWYWHRLRDGSSSRRLNTVYICTAA